MFDRNLVVFLSAKLFSEWFFKMNFVGRKTDWIIKNTCFETSSVNSVMARSLCTCLCAYSWFCDVITTGTNFIWRNSRVVNTLLFFVFLRLLLEKCVDFRYPIYRLFVWLILRFAVSLADFDAVIVFLNIILNSVRINFLLTLNTTNITR